MKRRELVPTKHEAIYAQFDDYSPNRVVQAMGFAAMRAVYRSEVYYRGNADQSVRSHLEEGGSVIVAPNHQSNADTPTIGGLIYEPAFELVRGKVIAPGKASLFRTPLLGRFFADMGVHPTFRSKDFTKDESGQELREAVTDSIIRLNVRHIDGGGSVAIFPEGTRNKGNPREIQKLRRGIGIIATSVEDPDQVRVVTMGFAYRAPRLHLRPIVVVNEPFNPVGMTVDEILGETHERITSATSEALERAAV